MTKNLKISKKPKTNRGNRTLRDMASAISANKAELLAIANSVAAEKMIDKAIVIEAMEEAIQKSARNRYGAENDIRPKLDPRTGDLRLWRGGGGGGGGGGYVNLVGLLHGRTGPPGGLGRGLAL